MASDLIRRNADKKIFRRFNSCTSSFLLQGRLTKTPNPAAQNFRDMTPATATATATAMAGSSPRNHARDAMPIKTLTNPFIAPTSCHEAFLPTTTITDSAHGLSQTTVWELQLASTEGCMPPGSYPTNGWLSFSPAVCPSGWTAYDMRGDSTYKMKTASVEFNARCCTRYVIQKNLAIQ